VKNRFRSIWRADIKGIVSGYTRAAKNLIQTVVRNAGHYVCGLCPHNANTYTITAFCNVADSSDARAQVPTDQPEVALSLITEFAATAAAHFRK
jgi:hypothetical protein